VTIKWLRWKADAPRIAAREKTDKRENPRLRYLNLDILYRILGLGDVIAEVLLLGVVVYRAVMVLTKAL